MGALAMLSWSTFVCNTAAAAAPCSVPGRDVLDEQTRAWMTGAPDGAAPAILTLETAQSGPRFQWIGLGRDAPLQGALLVADCSGRVLDAWKSGAVKQLARGPDLPELGPVVEVRSVVEAKVGGLVEEVQWYAFVDGALQRLWAHDAVERHLPAEGFEGRELRYAWNYDAGEGRIVVTGEETRSVAEENGRLIQSTPLPAELYCWSRTTRAFVHC